MRNTIKSSNLFKEFATIKIRHMSAIQRTVTHYRGLGKPFREKEYSFQVNDRYFHMFDLGNEDFYFSINWGKTKKIKRQHAKKILAWAKAKLA